MSTEEVTTQEMLERLVERESAAEQAVQYLCKELEQMKRVQHQSYIRPLLLDILMILDRQEAYLEQNPGSALESFHSELLETMARFEVIAIQEMPEVFDASMHSAVRKEIVADPKDHLKILRRLRKGYTYQGRILRAEEVVVARYQGPSGQHE